jgi:hypothetical protein
MTSLPRLRAIAAGVFMTGALALAVAPSAHAATLHGITPLAPKDGATVPAGQSPTFKMLVKGEELRRRDLLRVPDRPCEEVGERPLV